MSLLLSVRFPSAHVSSLDWGLSDTVGDILFLRNVLSLRLNLFRLSFTFDVVSSTSADSTSVTLLRDWVASESCR